MNTEMPRNLHGGPQDKLVILGDSPEFQNRLGTMGLQSDVRVCPFSPVSRRPALFHRGHLPNGIPRSGQPPRSQRFFLQSVPSLPLITFEIPSKNLGLTLITATPVLRVVAIAHCVAVELVGQILTFDRGKFLQISGIFHVFVGGWPGWGGLVRAIIRCQRSGHHRLFGYGAFSL